MKTSISILLTTLVISAVSFAGKDDTKQCPNDGKDYKECKLARKNDQGASKYLLMESGQLLRITDDNGIKCTIDQDVLDIKVSQHPKDAAVLYYTKKSDLGKKLVVVNNVDGDFAGKCMKVTKKVLVDNVKEFSMVSNSKTTIVNAALTKSGEFLAWDNNAVVYRDFGVVDYQMNTCYGSEGKSFSSYALFTLDATGTINKVKGEASSGKYIKSPADNGRYGSIRSFIDARNVCQ